MNKKATPEKPETIDPSRETVSSTRQSRKKTKREPTRADAGAKPMPEPKPAAESEMEAEPANLSVATMLRKNIIPAGQPCRRSHLRTR